MLARAGSVRRQAGGQNGLAAAITQGCAENGHLDLSHAESLELAKDGELLAYNSLGGVPRARFEEWMRLDPEVNKVVREAMQEAGLR